MGDPSLQGRKYHAHLPYLRHGGSPWFSWLSAQAPPLLTQGRGKASLGRWLRSAVLWDCALLLSGHVTGQRAEPGVTAARARASGPFMAEKAGEEWRKD